MPTQETTPLLGSNRGHEGNTSTPPFNPLKSSRYLLLGSWINVLLVAVPLSFIADGLHWSAAARFATSFLAIVPLAKHRTTLDEARSNARRTSQRDLR
ncbi:uncharacterized protein I303_103664 [Kwoniella dejecticola CBS 10117]|uniref:Uncharacterized protein n=1 Tax=Kwoniella dejecticola CBS 10117 TaxID=1296121 RepID=A0AAJ8MG81_9TREE